MKKDSSTECWSNCWSEVSDEWFIDVQKHAFRMYFVMLFTLTQLGNVTGKMILDVGCGEGSYSR
jgi:2-polyprenyl-3-methyl-5-hydroxy-6-metoxy-1,4-benzoquinol methylase